MPRRSSTKDVVYKARITQFDIPKTFTHLDFWKMTPRRLHVVDTWLDVDVLEVVTMNIPKDIADRY